MHLSVHKRETRQSDGHRRGRGADTVPNADRASGGTRRYAAVHGTGMSTERRTQAQLCL